MAVWLPAGWRVAKPRRRFRRDPASFAHSARLRKRLLAALGMGDGDAVR